jgi:hypothetical protein
VATGPSDNLARHVRDLLSCDSVFVGDQGFSSLWISGEDSAKAFCSGFLKGREGCLNGAVYTGHSLE